MAEGGEFGYDDPDLDHNIDHDDDDDEQEVNRTQPFQRRPPLTTAVGRWRSKKG